MRYSCRAVVGHGQKCEPNYQCDACAAKQKYIPRIEKLEARILLLEGWLNGSLNIIEAFVAADTKEARKALEGKDD